MNAIYKNKAFQRGLNEIKLKDYPDVKTAIMQILGITTDQSFRNYAAGRTKNLDVAKYAQISALFARYGITNPWGL